jgi:enoyl-CoA hydratase
MSNVTAERDGEIQVITLSRPHVRNAIDRQTARELLDAFLAFDADTTSRVAVLTGAAGQFCAGADLKAIASGTPNAVTADGDGPLGPTRRELSKPVVAAVEGYAVAGGLELALWCDLRVAGASAIFGVFCRRWGVPLLDGGTVRLPRLIGHGRAMDMILTGRPVNAAEALQMGLVSRVVPAGDALQEAVVLARMIASFPSQCMRADRQSALAQWGLTSSEAFGQEARLGMAAVEAGEALSGVGRFASGEGRHGTF